MTINELTEPSLGLNDFKSAKTKTSIDALMTTILLILFGKPGCIPSLPEVGMNISQLLYTFQENIDINSIKVTLASQCSIISDLIDTGDLDIQKVINDNGKIALLIAIPMKDNNTGNNLVIGISTDASGSVIYNYELMSASFSE